MTENEKFVDIVQQALGVCSKYYAQSVVNQLIENGVGFQKEAHWEIDCDGYYPYCSNCRHEPEGRKMTKFYEDCGAKMGGVK